MIFDVDGTLVDSNDAHARAWLAAFAEHGITVAYEPVRRAIGMGGDKLMPLVAGIGEKSSVGKRVANRRGEIFQQLWLPTLHSFPRTRELVERPARTRIHASCRQLCDRRRAPAAPGGRRRRRSHPHPLVLGRRGQVEAGSGHRQGGARADRVFGGSGDHDWRHAVRRRRGATRERQDDCVRVRWMGKD